VLSGFFRETSGLRTARGLIAPIAALLLVLAGTLMTILFYSASSMNQLSMDQQRKLTDNGLSLRLVQALSELRSVAWWDEMVVKSRVAEFDPEWLDIEVGVFVTTSYKHDRILILDEDNRPVYGFGGDARLDAATLEHYGQLVLPLVEQIRGGKNASPRIADTTLTDETREVSNLTNRTYGRGAAALMSDQGKPVLASIMSITPSMEMALNAKRPRLLVSVIDVNGQVLRDIGNSILMPDLSYRNQGDRRVGNYVLKSDDGRLMGRLGWTPEQPGNAFVRSVLPILLIVLLSVGLIIAMLFARLFTSTRQLAAREVEAQHLANHDALTGLANRRKLKAQFALLGSESTPNAQSVSIACIDLDRFKDINDTLGHQAGDALIRAVAARIEDALRPQDILARLGGDELTVLRHYRAANDGDGLAAAIGACFARPFAVLGHEIETHASIGVANGAIGSNFDDLMRQADIALYEAKAQGRARAVRFVAPMAEKLQRRRSIETDLRRAITDRELTLHYQPIVEAASGAMTSVEALMRWTSPTHGVVTPDVFIGIAEESGMMAELGRFVIEQAIEDSQKWPQLSTAINISPAQLRSVRIVQDLIAATTRFGVSPQRITLEITETVLMSNDDRTLKVLNQLKAEGFGLALDDFGTGYSSLSYLRDFPFDKLKIDRSFVKGLSVDDRALAIVKGVVNFGRILGREIVAEGIETEQEMQAMQQAGCTHLQGFLFSRALPADHIEALAATFGRLSTTRAPVLQPAQSGTIANNIRRIKTR
jgi:diguanylate cyclase (GGDEF)-like protein